MLGHPGDGSTGCGREDGADGPYGGRKRSEGDPGQISGTISCIAVVPQRRQGWGVRWRERGGREVGYLLGPCRRFSGMFLTMCAQHAAKTGKRVQMSAERELAHSSVHIGP